LCPDLENFAACSAISVSVIFLPACAYFGYLRRNADDAPDSDYTGYDFRLTKLNVQRELYQRGNGQSLFIVV
jgi:hypothetical protein